MTTGRAISIAGSLALLISCSSTSPGLYPAPRADKLSGRRGAAEENDSQTRVVVQTAAWPGDTRLLERATPLRVTVENHGGDPLTVSYHDFVLEGHEQTYAALPPVGALPGTPSDEAPPLIDGVLEPGDSASGWIYFERVDDDEHEVELRAHLDSAKSRMEVVNVSIPLMVVD